MAANLSDIAAMAGVPLAAMVSVKSFTRSRQHNPQPFLEGREQARKWKTQRTEMKSSGKTRRQGPPFSPSFWGRAERMEFFSISAFAMSRIRSMWHSMAAIF